MAVVNQVETTEDAEKPTFLLYPLCLCGLIFTHCCRPAVRQRRAAWLLAAQ